MIWLNYRIDYPGSEPKVCKIRGKYRLAVMTGVFFLAFLLLVKSFWPAGLDKLQSMFIPGGAENRAAFRQMVAQLRNGTDLADALTVFCRQVIDHAS